MTAETVIGAASPRASAEFRTCPYTGLKVDAAAQALIKANAVAAVVFLALGGLMGLLVALTRWPAVHLLPAEWFYLVLTGHGANVLLFWIIFFEIAVLYFASAVLLNCRLAGAEARLARLRPDGGRRRARQRRGAAGRFERDVHLLSADAGEAAFLSRADPVRGRRADRRRRLLRHAGGRQGRATYEGSIPLVTFGALTAAIIAVFTIASGAIILIPTFLWSIGLISDIDPLMYKVVWWGMGHSSQQINVSAHVAIWYLIAALLVGAKPLSEKVSRTAFLMYILFLQLASAHHLLAEPGLDRELEDRQHQLHDVSRGDGLDGPRADRAGLDRGGAAPQRLQQGRVRVAAQGALGASGVRRHVPVAGDVRLHRRHLRRRARHRAAQRADAQHALCARPLPRDRRRRHHARLHGGDLSRAAADLPARDRLAEAGADGSPICSASARPASRCS